MHTENRTFSAIRIANRASFYRNYRPYMLMPKEWKLIEE
jgi:hypothetical protein